MQLNTKDLIKKALQRFAHATGLKAVHHVKALKEKNEYPDGLIRITHQGMHWDFAVKVKARVTPATLALEKTQPMLAHQGCILVTEYVTPPMTDLLKHLGLFFMDVAGNAYLENPPLYVFIKGHKPLKEGKPAPIRRLFKPAGLKVVFALLNVPKMVNWPYRKIAAMTDVALGTVDWIFRDLKEMGFLVEMGRRKRKIANPLVLFRRWVEAYPEQLRPKLGIERFKADQPEWWINVDIKKYNACWGGEVAAAKITQKLKPQKVIIYAPEVPGKLVIEKKLRRAITGDIEILNLFWKFDHKFTALGIVPLLLVYADLLATGDDRNMETAEIIYENYLAQPGWQD